MPERSLEYESKGFAEIVLWRVSRHDSERQPACRMRGKQCDADHLCAGANHDNATHDAVVQAGKFAVAVLPTDVEPSLIGGFGYRSGRDINKFAEILYQMQDGMPVPRVAMAWITCEVVQTMDAGTHTIFLGKVLDCDVTREDTFPMTYQYYHTVIKGQSPKNAPTYVPPEENA